MTRLVDPAEGGRIARRGQRLPTSNRGVSRFSELPDQPRTWAGLDWLAFVFPLERLLREINSSRSWATVLEDLKAGADRCAADVANLLFCFFVREYGLVLSPTLRSGRFYLWRFQLFTPGGEHAGLLGNL